MKIVIMNTTDIVGSAARYDYRLHKGLQNIGVDLKYIVQNKFSTDKGILTVWFTAEIETYNCLSIKILDIIFSC